MNYRDILFYKYLHGSGGSQPAWDGATFPSYANGTEQILPENESDPDSSPFLGDIRYPDGTRRNNYFLYRESPNTVDGQAKITRIKGNTVVFNQLVQNGNFANTSIWSVGGATLTASDNKGILTATGAEPYIRQFGINIPNGHKVLLLFDVIATSGNLTSIHCVFQSSSWVYAGGADIASQDSHYSAVITVTANADRITLWNNGRSASDVLVYSNIMLIDLTQLNNSAITDASSFRSYYNLPYYDYTQGKLLPFKGESLKTTGKNLIDVSQVQVGKSWNNQSNTARACTFVAVKPNTQYTISIDGLNGLDGIFCACESVIGTQTSPNVSFSLTNSSKTFTTPNDCKYLAVQGNKTDITKADYVRCNFQLEFGSSASSYEPYTSSTINLPTLTYFPTGMKDVPDYTNGGKIYDEMTENLASHRVDRVDLGTLTWNYSAARQWFAVQVTDKNIKYPTNNSDVANVLSASFLATSRDILADNTTDNMKVALNNNSQIIIRDLAYDDATTFKNAMSGQYLYFELATPTEEPISSQTQLQNQALSTILGKTVSVDSPEEPLNILLKGE